MPSTVAACHAMGGHGWILVTTDGYGLGLGSNLKENVGLWFLVLPKGEHS